ncbi:MAG TPA: TetR/AcrR family transcriptional regulator [Rhodospirillales bacterium]
MAAKKAARKKATTAKPGKGATRARILETALTLAGDKGWQEVSFIRLGRRLGMTLAELRRHYRDLDAIADAWFRRAQDAMLAKPPAGFHDRPAKQRLEFLILRWFDALAPYRRITAEMLAGKLWLFHPHHYVPMVFNLSRLIQWLRDAAGLTVQGTRRQAEEIGLTLTFIVTLAVWCRDETEGQARTRAFLAARLDQADALLARFAGGTG